MSNACYGRKLFSEALLVDLGVANKSVFDTKMVNRLIYLLLVDVLFKVYTLKLQIMNVKF